MNLNVLEQSTRNPFKDIWIWTDDA